MHATFRLGTASSDEPPKPTEQRARRAALESIATGSGFGLFELDLSNGRARWLGDWCNRLNLDPCDGQDHLARWDAHIHAEDLPEASRRFDAHLAGVEDYYDAEYRIRDRAGRWHWLLERGRVVERTPHGAALRMVGVCMEVEARKRTERQRARARRRLQEREIIEIAHREQQRIGSDLHDGLGQELTGIALMLRAIGAQLRKEASAACGDIDDVIGLVNAAIENTRALARGLSPVGAEPEGLSAALQALAARATEQYGIPVTFQGRIARDPPFDPKSATHLYRIAQEALTNAMRHGGATKVRILVRAGRKGLELRVTDNGRGLPGVARDGSDGLGLNIMRHRAAMLGGTLFLRAGAGGGTTVHCSCPLEGATHKARAPGVRTTTRRSGTAARRARKS